MKIIRKVEKVLSTVENITAVGAFVVMCFVVLWSVICRYLLHRQFGYGEEIARYFMIYAIFIGISIGVRKEAHLGVEAFVGFLPVKLQPKVMAFSKIVCCIIYAMLFVLAARLVISLGQSSQKSPALHLPMWIPYFALPLGLFFSTLRSVHVALLAVSGQENKEKEEVDV